MKLVCAPDGFAFPRRDSALHVVLYGQPGNLKRGSAGEAAKDELLRQGLVADQRSWDFLSIALSVVTADLTGLRDKSPDGWTREFEVEVAVADPGFWDTQAGALESALAFLTTDRWRVRFLEHGFIPQAPRRPVLPSEDCAVLLSGGLDSLVGAIDLVVAGKKPIAVSQVVRGDAEKQTGFAERIGRGLRHLQLNHNAHPPGREESSQRARSLIFLAFGVLAATSLRKYAKGDTVPLYVCENGFIAVNPPLTGARLGSLSTRTAHPVFLRRVQHILDAAAIRVRIENPYQHSTKGEMLVGCTNQEIVKAHAAVSTSCGRFQRYGYKHCGRCVPCQIRRAAFLKWGVRDTTKYVFEKLGKKDADHAAFDDVRSAAIAIAEVNSGGLDGWLGPAISSALLGDVSLLKAMVKRGLDELSALHIAFGVK